MGTPVPSIFCRAAAGVVASQSRPARRSSLNGARPSNLCMSTLRWWSSIAASSKAGPSGPSTGLTGGGSVSSSVGRPVSSDSRSTAPATPSFIWLSHIHRANRPLVAHPPG